MGIILYKHNADAYQASLEMLARTGKAAVVHPTGTGKSFIGFKLCEDHPDGIVCWLSPSEYIFRTQLENLRQAAGGYVPENIRFFTYAKLMLMEKEELLQIRPDYLVLDEFHRCGARMWGAGVQRLLDTCPSVKVLGLSATNVRYLDGQRDMADELFDGNVSSRMTLGEAIVRGILGPPKYVLSLYSYQKELERYERRVRAAKGRAVRDAGERYLEALRRALEQAEGLDQIFAKHMEDRTGKYLVFCAGKEHMDEMIRMAPEWFARVDTQPHIYSVYAEDAGSEKIFAEFKTDSSSHLKLLYCIDMLNEGIHVEGISGVILLRPTVSPIIYKQQIGRAFSAARTKEAVIFDIVDNISGLYSISELEEEMDEAAAFYRMHGESRYIVNESFRIIDEVRDCRRLFEDLERTLSAPWEIMYSKAKEYYQTHGNLLPLQSYETEEGYKLGQWIVSQRAACLKGTLDEERIRMLEQIGMEWQTFHERCWEEGYSATKRYREEKGNLDIPAAYETETGFCLGRWYRKVRRQYQEGSLPQERVRLLEELGMEWTPVRDRAWMQNYARASAYYRKYGNLNVHAGYKTPDGENLGTWIVSQRSSYNKNKLSREQARLLEQIGMCWQRDDSRFDEACRHAEAYYREHGDLLVPTGYVSGDGFALGMWIATQRSRQKSGKLSAERAARLEQIGMDWDPSGTAWQTGYAHARQYYEIHGNLKVTSTYVEKDGFRLGAWVSNKRHRYRKGLLNQEQAGELEKLGIVWEREKKDKT